MNPSVIWTLFNWSFNSRVIYSHYTRLVLSGDWLHRMYAHFIQKAHCIFEGLLKFNDIIPCHGRLFLYTSSWNEKKTFSQSLDERCVSYSIFLYNTNFSVFKYCIVTSTDTPCCLASRYSVLTKIKKKQNKVRGGN